MKNLTYTFFLAIALFIAPFSQAQRNSESFKSEALQHMNNGKYGEAIDLLNRYVSAYPQRADGYNLRGLCYEQRAQYEMAVYDFRSARKLEPNNKDINANLKRTTDTWYTLLLNKIEGHKREIAINPVKAVNYLEIGKCHKHMGHWLVAEEWYDEYLKREEASADEIIRYSEILAKNNHISKGEPILKRYTEKYPDDHRLWSRYGYFTLWLGKNQVAIRAFTNALELRPFFKEALDGLDLARGRGYIYTINDTSSRHNYGLPVGGKEYPIDKHYRHLRKNPADEETRILLVKELMKANRLEEAYNQLQILSATKSEDPEFRELWEEVMNYRKKYYADQIDVLQDKLSKSPYDKDAILKLGQYYSYKQEYDKAVSLFDFYLARNPRDHEVRYNLALISAWRKDFQRAKTETDIILKDQPANIRYQLLGGQLAVWMNTDLDKGESYLLNVINKEPDNFNALLALGTLKFQKNEIDDAEKYTSLANEIDASNVELKKLEYMISLQNQRNEEAARYNILETARNYAFNEQCDKAVEYFNKYLESDDADKKVRLELAQAYVCLKDYKAAIVVYDKVLEDANDFETDKQRAKVYFWAGDSLSALREFERLYSIYPEDAEVQLYLGDCYMQWKEYDKARQIYSDMLAVAPSSQLVQMRLDWLSEGRAGEFPTYIMISPQASYYTDNLDLRFDMQGLRVEIGLVKFLGIGISGLRGGIRSEVEKINFNTIKGHVFISPSKFVSIGGGFGRTFFTNDLKAEAADGFIRFEDKSRYSAEIGFSMSDAALILYSPFLVNNRLNATHVFARGEYNFKSGMLLSGKYSFTSVSDDNNGNGVEVRIGKAFDPELSAGYEYYQLTYDNASTLYWSPDNYESHSMWADWHAFRSDEGKLTFGGKLGLIPESNYVLREVYGLASFKLADQFTLQAKLTAGSTVQQKIGYSSTSLNIAVFWNL